MAFDHGAVFWMGLHLFLSSLKKCAVVHIGFPNHFERIAGSDLKKLRKIVVSSGAYR